jgi:hypothetical protein
MVTDIDEGSEWEMEPLHVFRASSRTAPDLLVYADHIELSRKGGRDVVALWYRHIERVVPIREPGQEALAIVDRGGQILLAPMALNDAIIAQRLIGSVMEWVESGPRNETPIPS